MSSNVEDLAKTQTSQLHNL